MKKIESEKLIFILSGPSGVGKSTVFKRIINDKTLNLQPCVSYSTRPKRFHEVNKKDYFFVSNEEFEKMIEEKQFIEYIKFQQYYYGTHKYQILDILNQQKKHVFLEIDVEGTRAVSKIFKNVVKIFLIPENFEVLKKRIIKRGTENQLQIKNRLKKAYDEIQEKENYDYQVINYDIADTVKKIKDIILIEIRKLAL